MNHAQDDHSPRAAAPASLRDLVRAGHRARSTLAACQHRCAGGHVCTLASGHPHRWHICDNPHCACHEAMR